MNRRLLSMLSQLLLLCAAASISGCGQPRVVLVPPGELIRVGPDTHGYVYVLTVAGWERSRNRVTLPEGWYAGPPEPTDTHRE